jgi:hypothetical protein
MTRIIAAAFAASLLAMPAAAQTTKGSSGAAPGQQTTGPAKQFAPGQQMQKEGDKPGGFGGASQYAPGSPKNPDTQPTPKKK